MDSSFIGPLGLCWRQCHRTIHGLIHHPPQQPLLYYVIHPTNISHLPNNHPALTVSAHTTISGIPAETVLNCALGFAVGGCIGRGCGSCCCCCREWLLRGGLPTTYATAAPNRSCCCPQMEATAGSGCCRGASQPHSCKSCPKLRNEVLRPPTAHPIDISCMLPQSPPRAKNYCLGR